MINMHISSLFYNVINVFIFISLQRAPYILFTADYTLYHGLATFTEVTFVDVHNAQMSTFVIEVTL